MPNIDGNSIITFIAILYCYCILIYMNIGKSNNSYSSKAI